MGIVYVIAPQLTLRTSPVADSFLEAFSRALSDYSPLSILRSHSALRTAEPDHADVVIFFNRADPSYEAPVLTFLQRTSQAGAKILPVAVSKDERRPPEEAGDAQSFDLVEHLRQRALEPSQAGTIATVFARQVLTVLRPTLFSEPMHLFLSHRRLDGEEITAAIHRTLLGTTQRAFRDLFDVRVGEDAQDVIESRLRESDAVIFLDTPKSGESPWIAKELRVALDLQLPVVWVRIGPEDVRVPLRLLPAAAPHFAFPDLDPASNGVSSDRVDAMVQMAFDVHHRDYVDRLLDDLGRLKDLARGHGIQLSSVDPRRMLFSLALPRKPERYRQRPLTHLLQLFGRAPTRQDLSEFPTCAKEVDYGPPHPKHGPHYDSAILLAATPSRPVAAFDESGIHVDSIGDYVAEIERLTTRRRPKQKRLVISGAFADCEPEYQQNMTNAVHAVVEGALRAGVGISFGAHPTFQFMIFDLARRLRPDDYFTALRMYISRFFVTDATIAEHQGHAEVIALDAVGGDRARSLTAMRHAMLKDPEAAALVVIGGKTKRGGHSPGVDEEMDIARGAGLPVYVFGSVGGRSSELIAAMMPAERAALNGQPESINEEFATSFDYGRLAKIILDSSF